MADNLSLLSAVAAIGMTDPFSDSGIPSRRIYTLTGQTAQAWSRFLDRAAVGGDPYTTTERPGALEAARAFLDSIPVDRLSRARKATVAKLIRNLEPPMSRRPNPAESVRILRAANPNSSVSIAKLIQAYPAETAAIGFNAANPYAPAHTRALQRFANLLLSKLQAAYRKDGVVAFQPGSDIVRYSGFNPRSGDLDAMVSETLQELAGGARTGNPSGKIVLPFKRGSGPAANVAELLRKAYARRGESISATEAAKRAKGFQQGLLLDGSLLKSLKRPSSSSSPLLGWVRGPLVIFDASHYIQTPGFGSYAMTPEGGVASGDILNRTLADFRLQDIRFADPDGTLHNDETRTGNPGDDFDTLEKLRANVEKATRRFVATRQAGFEKFERDDAQEDYDAARDAYAAAQGGGARTGNPPALIWEFDGEPTSPKALLADNPDSGDVAAAVAYLKAEGAKFSMGRHGTKSVRSWSAVSFGGGAADESVLTVRADWTDGPVFKAVLDASTIPYAGDLPDADSPFSHRAGSDNYQDDFLSDFEEYEDGDD